MTKKIIIVNSLTLIRLIGALILIPVYYNFGAKCVAIISLISYLTDFIDGTLARKYNASTFFGAIFDGVVDKLLTIINFIILYLITPYSIIPIILEILTLMINIIKYVKNLNVQSNIIGKSKIFVLALTIILTFIISDINSITIMPDVVKNYLSNIDNSLVYLYILIPTIIMEILTLISYLYEIIKAPKSSANKKPGIKPAKLSKKDFGSYLKNVVFNPAFYEEHKNDSNLRDLRNESRSN